MIIIIKFKALFFSVDHTSGFLLPCIIICNKNINFINAYVFPQVGQDGMLLRRIRNVLSCTCESRAFPNEKEFELWSEISTKDSS